MSVLYFGRLGGEAARFVEDQFLAWQKAQEALGRTHRDKRKALRDLGTPMKLAIAQGFAPAVCQLLGDLGREALIDFRQAGIGNERDRLEDRIETFAAEYHEYWLAGRTTTRAIGAIAEQPGFGFLAARADDVPWAELPDEERKVVREIVWQWSLMLAEWDEDRFICFCDLLFGTDD